MSPRPGPDLDCSGLTVVHFGSYSLVLVKLDALNVNQSWMLGPVPNSQTRHLR